MKTIKVDVFKKEPHCAFGKTKDKKLVIVRNGDLKNVPTTLDVIIIGNDVRDSICSEITETYESCLVIEEFMDKDGLIEIIKIDKIISNRLFELKKKWLFPNKIIHSVLDYILCFAELKKKSKISLTDKRVVTSSARIFGLSFEQALSKLTRMGLQQARLYCEKEQDFSEDGVVAEMLINLTKDNKGIVSIEAWQGVKESCRVHYIHGMMDEEQEVFQHFDGAIIEFEIHELNQLFRENKKLKGNNYKKLFRLDGEISCEHVFELSNRFFPLENLSDEYF